MSDPFDYLRPTPTDPPDIDAILERAQKIAARRRLNVTGLGALALVIIAGAALMAGPMRSRDASRPGLDLASNASPSPQSLGSTPVASFPSAAGSVAVTDPPSTRLVATPPTSSDPRLRDPQPITDVFRVSADVPDRVQWKKAFSVDVEVCNRTNEKQTADFRSGKRIDLTAHRDGREVWRWSASRAFTQELGSESFGPGACRRWTAEAEQGAFPPGDYQVFAEFATEPTVVSGPSAVRCESS